MTPIHDDLGNAVTEFPTVSGSRVVPVQHQGGIPASTNTIGKVYVTDGTDDADVVQNKNDSDNIDQTKGVVTAGVLYGRVNSTKIRPLRIDGSTHSIQTVDYAHHEIHGGSYFSAYHSAASKNDGQTINIYFKTANTNRYCHVFAKWASSGAAYFNIREAPTVTSNTGTNGQAIYNHNRTSSNTSGVFDNATTPAVNKYAKDVTVAAGGTIIWQEYAGTGRTAPGGGRNEDEFVLDADTKYVFEVESDAAGLSLGLVVQWYEHIDKN